MAPEQVIAWVTVHGLLLAGVVVRRVIGKMIGA